MEKELKEIEEKEIITEEDIDKNNPEYFENNENENKEYDESRIYYVYKHIRLDNNTCFYVGKGKGNRKDIPLRNKHHDNICKRYGYKVEKIQENLTEEEAFELEREIIEEYVFTFGYGINIDGYNKGDNEIGHLTNCTWGGEGASGMHHSEETKMKMSEANSGEKNPMFGKNPYANKTPEEMETIGKKISESHNGKHHSEEAKRKMRESHKGKKISDESKQKMSESSKGEKNGMWGKKGENSPVYGEKNGMWGKPAANRSKVICVTTGKIFDCIKDAEKYYSCSSISACCRGKRNYAGKLQDGTKLQWMYLEDYNNEFKGILINLIAE